MSPASLSLTAAQASSLWQRLLALLVPRAKPAPQVMLYPEELSDHLRRDLGFRDPQSF